jgi:hypothetical protein
MSELREFDRELLEDVVKLWTNHTRARPPDRPAEGEDSHHWWERTRAWREVEREGIRVAALYGNRSDLDALRKRTTRSLARLEALGLVELLRGWGVNVTHCKPTAAGVIAARGRGTAP